MSDYCKFNPDDPTCFGGDTYGFGLSSYATQTNKFTTNVPRRDFTLAAARISSCFSLLCFCASVIFILYIQNNSHILTILKGFKVPP